MAAPVVYRLGPDDKSLVRAHEPAKGKKHGRASYAVPPEHAHFMPQLGGARNVQGAFGMGTLRTNANGTTLVYFKLGSVTAKRKFPTCDDAKQFLEDLRRKHNAYVCWWWREEGRIVVVHRLHLDTLMYFDDDALGEQAATAHPWCPEWTASGRVYARAGGHGASVTAHRYVADQHGHGDWKKVAHFEPVATLDNRITNLRDGTKRVFRTARVAGKNNHSQVTGVYLAKKGPPRWVAQITVGGETKKTAFYITDKMSYNQARDCAIKQRKFWEEQKGIENNSDGLLLLERSTGQKRTTEQATLWTADLKTAKRRRFEQILEELNAKDPWPPRAVGTE